MGKSPLQLGGGSVAMGERSIAMGSVYDVTWRIHCYGSGVLGHVGGYC